MQKNLLFLFSIALALGLGSCQQFSDLDEIEAVSYQGEYAIPLVNTQLKMRDILQNFEENTTITFDPDGLIHLHYEGDVISQNSDDVFANINAQLPPLIPVTSKRMALSFSTPDGLQIDKIIFKSGTLVYGFQSNDPAPMNVTIRFPQMRRNDVPLELTTSIPGYSGSGNLPTATNLFSPRSLADYHLTTENDSIYIEYEATRIGSGDPGNLTNFFIRLQDLAFFYAEGYLGELVFEGGRDTIGIDFFESWIDGEIFFAEPKITYFLENAFGVPTRSIINVLQVLTVDGQTLPMASDVIGAGRGVDFGYPTLAEVGEVKTTVFTFDKNNSNITDILSAGPVSIDYEINALANPDGDANIRGFITDSSYYKVRMEVDLPFYGQASNFIARDTIDISFDNWQEVDAAEFKVVTENYSPLDVVIQGFFTDENGNLLDALLSAPQRLIAGAPVDADGNVVQPAEEISYAPFPTDRFSSIKRADKIIIVAEFATSNDGEVPVRVLGDQDVKIRVGAKLTISN